MTKEKLKLGLGTVQWGINYGISNLRGKTSANEVGKILAIAAESGISLLDTAAQYGVAEATLGAHSLTAFKIVTKTPHFSCSVFEHEHSLRLLKSFDASLQRLNTKSVYGLLVHNSSDLLGPGANLLLKTLVQLKTEGRVLKIGVSVYNSEEIRALLALFTPDLIQLPLNVLDQRLLKNGDISRLKELDVEIHVRSVFLQGLLLMPPTELPAKLQQHMPILARWQQAALEQGLTPRQAALAFVRDRDEIDHLLVGVESEEQLQECLNDYLINTPFDGRELCSEDVTLLNPALWAN